MEIVQINNLVYDINEEIIDILLKDRNTGKNIIFATSNYSKKGYKETNDIRVEFLKYRSRALIRARIDKSKEEQRIRSKEKAEEIRTKRASLPRLDWMIEQGLVNIGDRLCVISHPSEMATIIDGKNVEYNGEIMSLNAFGSKVTGWQHVRSYGMIRPVNNTKTLNEIREERMKELEMI